VIVTTHARPHLVATAVASVVAQSFHNTEMVVVVDGADAATEAFDVILFAGRWIVPGRVRRAIRSRLASDRQGTA
jgi:hypothetical protein